MNSNLLFLCSNAVSLHNSLKIRKFLLAICNGFQALVKSGLLPYGRLGMVTKDSPTLFRNDINRHISQIVSTRVSTLNSPWLAGFGLGDIHSIAVSHGEGKFVVSEELARELFANGQVAFQYVDPEGRATPRRRTTPTVRRMPSRAWCRVTARSSARWGIRSVTRKTSSKISQARRNSRCSAMPSTISAKISTT